MSVNTPGSYPADGASDAEDRRLVRPRALRRRAVHRRCRRRAKRACGVSVDTAAPDLGGAEDAQLYPERFSRRGRLTHRATVTRHSAIRKRGTGLGWWVNL